MPYRNSYNKAISDQIRNIDNRHIDRINSISETNSYDIATPLESMTLRHRDITGGSGFAAATVQDLGFDPTLGATPDRNVGRGSSGGGSSGGGMSGGGMSGGALLTLTDMYKMVGQPPPMMQSKITQQAAPHKDQPIPEPQRGSAVNGPLAGSGKSRATRATRQPSKRNELVRKIMSEQKLNLPAASRYIKEHNLTY